MGDKKVVNIDEVMYSIDELLPFGLMELDDIKQLILAFVKQECRKVELRTIMQYSSNSVLVEDSSQELAELEGEK